MTDYTIYSIRAFNNNNLVFYNYTKQKRMNDVLCSYKSRYKRYLNNRDNFMNIFYILQTTKPYIRIEERFTTDNDDNIKSKLYDYIANNNCINKLDTYQIEKLVSIDNKNDDKTKNTTKEPTTKEPTAIENTVNTTKEPTTKEPTAIEPTTEITTTLKKCRFKKSFNRKRYGDNNQKTSKMDILNDKIHKIKLKKTAKLATKHNPVYDVNVDKKYTIKKSHNIYKPP